MQAQVEQQVAELSRKRQAAAVRLGSGVEAGLRELSMASSRFDVRISRRSSAEVSCLVPVDYCRQHRKKGTLVHKPQAAYARLNSFTYCASAVTDPCVHWIECKEWCCCT